MRNEHEKEMERFSMVLRPAMVLFGCIVGEIVHAPMELAAAAPVRMAPDHVLARARAADAVPDPVWRLVDGTLSFPVRPSFRPSHERALWGT